MKRPKTPRPDFVLMDHFIHRKKEGSISRYICTIHIIIESQTYTHIIISKITNPKPRSHSDSSSFHLFPHRKPPCVAATVLAHPSEVQAPSLHRHPLEASHHHGAVVEDHERLPVHEKCGSQPGGTRLFSQCGGGTKKEWPCFVKGMV